MQTLYEVYRTADFEKVSNKFVFLDDAIAHAQGLYNEELSENKHHSKVNDYDVVKATDLTVVYTTALDGYFIN